jgi:hypothetical protein
LRNGCITRLCDIVNAVKKFHIPQKVDIIIKKPIRVHSLGSRWYHLALAFLIAWLSRSWSNVIF